MHDQLLPFKQPPVPSNLPAGHGSSPGGAPSCGMTSKALGAVPRLVLITFGALGRLRHGGLRNRVSKAGSLRFACREIYEGSRVAKTPCNIPVKFVIIVLPYMHQGCLKILGFD